MNSLNRLHLIILDPYTVTPSEAAIVEYNRLRQNHQPPYRSYEIQGNRYSKVKNNIWTMSKKVSEWQNVLDEVSSTIYGLSNIKKISRYANFLMQCIVQSNIIRQNY